MSPGKEATTVAPPADVLVAGAWVVEVAVVGMERVVVGPAATKTSPAKESGPATPEGSKNISPSSWTKAVSATKVVTPLADELPSRKTPKHMPRTAAAMTTTATGMIHSRGERRLGATACASYVYGMGSRATVQKSGLPVNRARSAQPGAGLGYTSIASAVPGKSPPLRRWPGRRTDRTSRAQLSLECSHVGDRIQVERG